MKLVIVESPAKGKTIERFLGRDYEVAASFGHIRDLPRTAKEIPSGLRSQPWARLGVDVDGDFEPVYVIPAESKKHITALRKKVRSADEIILATDEDREGESISWHLLEVLKPRIPVQRIAFHEITSSAIRAALANPRQVDGQLVRAQETRRVLDRLFGYSLSPVLWKKVRAGLSAGRVQSAALRLVVEREEERQRFGSTEYWAVKATLAEAAPAERNGEEAGFAADLIRTGGKAVATAKNFDARTGALRRSGGVVVLDEAAAARVAWETMTTRPWRVGRVEEKESRRRPAPPFITSTLQQAASSKLRMTPRRTMRLAQQLYEGVNLGGGDRQGLITYMRTDSVSLSQAALAETAAFIRENLGASYHQRRQFATRSRSAQEAHEAIRPTSIRRTPESLRGILDADQLKLYGLIWRRAVASQMADARIARTIIEFRVDAGEHGHIFRSVGTVVRFDGFLRVWGTSRKDVILPRLVEGQIVGGDEPAVLKPRSGDEPAARIDIIEVNPLGNHTQPRSRFSEATLVRKLEEEGIGRPSTYEPTLAKLRERNYAIRKKGVLVPTYVGLCVTHLLRDHFPHYVDLKFTAGMEDSLDRIAGGSVDHVRFLSDFFRGDGDGAPGLEMRIEEELPRIDYPALAVGDDPATGDPLLVRIGKQHVFLQRGREKDSPRATLPVDLLIDELTPEKASELIELRLRGRSPLGRDDETGLNIYVRTGPFGPYAQLGEDDAEPKRASLPKGMSPEQVDLDFALRLLSLPRMLGEDPGTGQPVKAGLGRYGPYVNRAKTYRNLDSVERAFDITLEEALQLLNVKPRRPVLAVAGRHPETDEPLNIYRGRYGPYVTDGKVNASIPRGRSPESLGVDEALDLLARAAARKAAGKGGRRTGTVRTRRRR
ncbi:MAG: type I DNA topoisomerase [Gammaproteobacteria bacterium]|nr:type I DNA topoisomerase [Gammaproteobacteria bacterium]MYC52078.1 type I DNA topoisomerase [Gammaproteobacteria bacterium]